MPNSDHYKTITKDAPETLFKDRSSKFVGYAFHVTSEEMVKEKLDELHEQHPKASHICYAWQLGKRYEHFRANDDGEPNNSAGMPIYGQLQSFELTEALVAVVRYYGGTNLGVGGLIHAYKTSAQITLEGAKIVSKTIKSDLVLEFDYPLINNVMRIIKEKI
ncbi:MAG: YigZ family protein [Leeuwenhoekiella sp.]